MLDLKTIREKPEFFKQSLRKKRVDPSSVDNLISLDAEKRNLEKTVDELRAKQNRSSKKIPGLPPAEKKKLLSEMQYVKEELQGIEPKLKKVNAELNVMLQQLPNPPAASVPEGEGDECNEIVKVVGAPPKFSFDPMDHVALGKKHDLIEIETAAEMSGTRFYYLKNQAVIWEFAILQFVLKKLLSKGFTPVIPPVLVKEHAMFGTGFFPADRNEIYHVNPEDDDLFLVGTAEVPLCMLYANKVIPGEELPKRLVGFSSCFRREAGTYGKDTHGIFRVHQFDKLEMFSFCHPDKSEKEHEFLLFLQEEIMRDIGLHYRVVNICGGDLGAPAAKKYDIEAWIPSHKKFRELTSCSNCTDFQARRCNIKCSNKESVASDKGFVHTLNGTAVAMSRMLIAIMENFQREDGTIKIPNCLHPYIYGKIA